MINATPVRPIAQPSSGTPAYIPPTPMAQPPVPPSVGGGSNAESSFTPKPKRKFSPKLILGALIFFLVLLGAGAGLYLTQVNQDLRQQAYGNVCSDSTTQAQCEDPNDQLSCSWDSNTKKCTTVSITSCSGYNNQAQCENPNDAYTCSWDGSTKKCTTVSVTNCSGFVNQAQCENPNDSLSCSWDGSTKKCTAPNITVCTGYNNQAQCENPNDALSCTWNSTTKVCSSSGVTTCTGYNNQAQCENPTDGLSCSWNNTTKVCSPSTGGGTPPPGGGTCTIAAGQRCGVTAGTCCANGGVCQGLSGQEVCQIPETTPAQQCADGGGTCTGWYGFRCSVLTNGTCHENGERFSNRSSAESHAGTCGQVDQVCVGGSNDGHLCGDFTIYNQCSGNPTIPPTTPPTAPPSTPPGPMCMSISMRVNGQTQGDNQASPRLGDTVQFTCGQVEGVNNYIFRVIEPGGIERRIEATGATSVPYTISKVGDFIGQCQICTGSGPNTCQPFETTAVSAE